MHAVVQRVFLPGVVVRLHVDALQAVPGDDVEFPHRIVELRLVARGDHHPAPGHGPAAKGLELEELQHGRRKRLRDTVDLVQEQYALPYAGAFDLFVSDRYLS